MLKTRNLCEFDNEKRVVINMTVKDDSNFLSVFSHNDDPVISTEVADFIENNANAAHPKEKLTLRIHSDCIDEREKTIYARAIKNYYSEKNIANSRAMKRNNVILLILLFLGVAVLAFSIFLSSSLENEVWPEVVDIVAWVLIWEAADIGIFKNSELRTNQKRFYAYEDMKIEYLSV